MKRIPLSICFALALSFSLVGCTGGDDSYKPLTEADDVENTHVDDHHHHDHASGPNGGHILEFGDYHGEITMGEDRVVSVYVLGDDAKTAVPVADGSVTLKLTVGEETQEIALTAAPLEGEADGQSSRFTAAADAIPESVKDIEGIAGSIDLKVGDKTHTAKVSHDHHGHDH